MNVYVVETIVHYEGSRIEGIFSSKEAAELFKTSLEAYKKKLFFDFVRITEFTLDMPIEHNQETLDKYKEELIDKELGHDEPYDLEPKRIGLGKAHGLTDTTLRHREDTAAHRRAREVAERDSLQESHFDLDSWKRLAKL